MSQINGVWDFEEGWTDLPPTPNFLINQRPNGWELDILKPGAVLWGSGDVVHGIPECVHKHIDQLPPNEQPGGADALILSGEYVYKIFHSGASFGVELSRSMSGLKASSRFEITVPVQVHRHDDGDLYAAEAGMWLNDEGGWTPVHLLPDRGWLRRKLAVTVPDDGVVTLTIRLKSKWPNPKDFFVDNITWSGERDGDEPPPPPPPVDDLEAAVADLQEGQAQQAAWLTALEVRIADVERRLAALEDGDPPPPPGGGLDMARYFVPENGWRGPVYIMANNWGQGDERVQLQADGPISWVVKNNQWERRRVTDEAVFLEMDTSPSHGEYYTSTGPWLPRFWQPDSTYVREQTVEFRRKSDCQPVPEKPAYTMTSEMRFLAHHPTWTTPDGALTLNDVVEIAWLVNGSVDETYWYAAGIGLVRWRKYSGQESVIVALYAPGEQEDNVREVIACAG